MPAANPDQSFEEALDEILDRHLQEFKAGHDSKVKAAITRKYHSELERIIGRDLDEADGWEWAFGDEAKCCPGDDFAYFGNHIKAEQRSRAGIEDKTGWEKGF